RTLRDDRCSSWSFRDVDVDEDRGVVRGLFALAGVAIDGREPQTPDERVGDEVVVDAQALLLVEAASPVVPPAEQAPLVVQFTEGVGEPPRLELLDSVPFRSADVGGVDEPGGIPDVDVAGGDVPVAGDHERL